MVSIIILYYNIIILWDHRRICGPSFSWRFSPITSVKHIRSPHAEGLIYTFASGKELLVNNSSIKKIFNILVKFSLSCTDFLGGRFNGHFHRDVCCFVSGSWPQTQLSYSVINLEIYYPSFWPNLAGRFRFWWHFNWKDINFTAICHIFKPSSKLHTHLPCDCPTMLPTVLFVRHLSSCMNWRTLTHSLPAI